MSNKKRVSKDLIHRCRVILRDGLPILSSALREESQGLIGATLRRWIAARGLLASARLARISEDHPAHTLTFTRPCGPPKLRLLLRDRVQYLSAEYVPPPADRSSLKFS